VKLGRSLAKEKVDLLLDQLKDVEARLLNHREYVEAESLNYESEISYVNHRPVSGNSASSVAGEL
jgi:hypothetical protein